MTNDERIVQMAIKKAGGVTKLARALGIKFQTIQNWDRIPADRIIAIEAAFDIPREKLRPDLYAPRRKPKRQIRQSNLERT
jgi:DNA-binding transcriptional regulator YdaS (Cro superfamily)